MTSNFTEHCSRHAVTATSKPKELKNTFLAKVSESQEVKVYWPISKCVKVGHEILARDGHGRLFPKNVSTRRKYFHFPPL